MTLRSADFESAFSTVACTRKSAHVDRITSYVTATCTVRAFRIALQAEALNTGAKYHQKYPRKTQRTRVPSLQNLVILRGYFWLVHHSYDRRIFGPPDLSERPNLGGFCRCHEWRPRSSLIASSHRSKVKSASLMLPNRYGRSSSR